MEIWNKLEREEEKSRKIGKGEEEEKTETERGAQKGGKRGGGNE